MLVPRVMDDLGALMRRFVDEEFRPPLINTKREFELGIIQKPHCMTDRPELLVAVNRLQEERTDVYQMYKRLILPILLHPRHDHVRFSSKPGEEGFYVNQQAVNSSSAILESATGEGGRVVNSVVCPILDQKLTDSKFRRKSVRVRGLLSMLRKVFWPTYNAEVHGSMARKYLTKEKRRRKAEAATGGKSGKGGKGGKGKESSSKRKKKQPAIRVSAKDKKRSSGCSWSTIDTVIHNKRGVGMELGKQVHNQLERFAKDHIAFALSREPVDPITRAVIRKLVGKWKLIPLWGELQIWDEVLRYCTAVDMVCLNPNGGGSLVFIEIKTGYKDVFTYHMRNVHGGIGVPDSPLGHAMLQLIIPIQTMKLRYGITNIKGYVVHVNEMEGVSLFKLPIDNPHVRGGISYTRAYQYAIRREKKGVWEPGIMVSEGRKRKRGSGNRGKGRAVPRSSPSSIVSSRTKNGMVSTGVKRIRVNKAVKKERKNTK